MKEQPSKRDCVKDWFHGPYFLIFVNYFSITWGYRMWNFSLGLFFVVLGEMELLLTAIYGFLRGGSVLIFGGVIGDWIDRNNRLTAIRKSLFIQKISTAICATLICVLLWFQIPINQMWSGNLRHLLNGLIIILAIISELATMCYMRIQLQKDWFVVTTRGKKSKLANLNAGARAIDQITNIVTPILTGQIMTSSSKIIAGVLIIVWHIMAIFVELILVTKIYRMIPEMATKQNDGKFPRHTKEDLATGDNKDTNVKLLKVKSTNNNDDNVNKQNGEMMDKSRKLEMEIGPGEEKNAGCIRSAFAPLLAMATGWKIYFKQYIVFAGIALSCLFMTVLGFDSVTTGYIYANGVPENVVGIANAIASCSGLLGAILFTQMRKCIGLERSGIISYSSEIIGLLFCVISIFMPGSQFQFDALWKNELQLNKEEVFNSTLINVNNSDHLIGRWNTSYNVISFNGTNMTETVGNDGPSTSFLSQSIIMFVVGICSSRVGLYVTDLVIAQTIQENVAETERGIVSGIQNSLNNLMDMLKFTLVMIVPKIQTFGYLVMLSYLFLCFGAIFFIYHSLKMSQFSCNDCICGRTINNSDKDVEEMKEKESEYK